MLFNGILRASRSWLPGSGTCRHAANGGRYACAAARPGRYSSSRALQLVPGAAALAERGPQDVLGGIGGRARGDRVGVGAVQVIEVDAVEGNPGVVACELQLPGRLADVYLTGACLGDAHDSRRPYWSTEPHGAHVPSRF